MIKILELIIQLNKVIMQVKIFDKIPKVMIGCHDAKKKKPSTIG